MKELLGYTLITLGLFAMLTAVVGMFRFDYALDRMHAAALADTLGAAFLAAGCIVLRGLSAATGKYLLLVIFLWLTGPIMSHLIAKAEYMTQPTPHDHWEEETQ